MDDNYVRVGHIFDDYVIRLAQSTHDHSGIFLEDSKQHHCRIARRPAALFPALNHVDTNTDHPYKLRLQNLN